MKYDFSGCGRAQVPPSGDQIRAAMAALDMTFVVETREYLREYGYLSKDGIEFSGMTGDRGLESDLITGTLAIRECAGWTWGYVLIESLGDSRYAMADKSDRVYIADMIASGFRATNKCLLEYIHSRLNGEGPAPC